MDLTELTLGCDILWSQKATEYITRAGSDPLIREVCGPVSFVTIELSYCSIILGVQVVGRTD